MNDKIKNMLIGIMEESAEITQACSKSIRFGLDNHHPNRDPSQTNANDIIIEYYHLQAIVEELQRNNILPSHDKEYIKYIKKNKLKRLETTNKY